MEFIDRRIGMGTRRGLRLRFGYGNPSYFKSNEFVFTVSLNFIILRKYILDFLEFDDYGKRKY